MTIDEFNALPVAEKSKLAGVRYFSEEEIAERAKKSEEMTMGLLKDFFIDLTSQENFVIGHLKTDDEMENTVSKPLNNLYQNAIERGATFEDLEGVAKAMLVLYKKVDMLRNTYNIDLQKLMYAMIGENYPDATPLKTIINLTQSFKEAKNPQE